MSLPVGVFEYNNFIDEEDRKILLEYVNFYDKWLDKSQIDYWADKRMEFVDEIAKKILLKIENKFIKLTKKGGGQIHINCILITILEEQTIGGSSVYVMGGEGWLVEETVDEIKKLIKKSESFTIKYD